MFSAFRELCERWLRIPPAPEPPPGDEGSTRVFRAAPNFYKYLLFLWALKSALALLVCGFMVAAPAVAAMFEAKKGEHWPFLVLCALATLLGLVAVGRLASLAIIRLDFEKRWYVVTDRSLRVREGVFNVSEMTVTFANIQNISVTQGPVQRALHIAHLRVDTAGGGGSTHGKHPSQNLHTAWFRGIDNAPEVRELIQRRLRQLKDAGLGDQDDRESSAHGTGDGEILEALREVLAEASALRKAAETA